MMKRSILTLVCVVLVGVLPARPINQLPMYGGQHEPTVEPNAETSKEAAAHGWKAYYQGDLDTAMLRFNQAWLFDQGNPEVYWGFGLVEGKRAGSESPEQHLKESIRFLKMAHELDPKNGKIIGDLAFSTTLLGRHFQVHGHAYQSYFETAVGLYETASQLSPEYPPVWATWSVCLFYSGDYPNAKVKADHAISIGYKFGADYMEQLEARLLESDGN